MNTNRFVLAGIFTGSLIPLVGYAPVVSPLMSAALHAVSSGAVLGFTTWAVARQRGTDARRLAKLQTAAVTDPLTGLGNRRAADEHIAQQVSRARRTGEALSVLMVDLDHFKRINDTFGHAVGDRVLAAVSDAIRAVLRPYDRAFRYGGEELLIVSGADPAEAAQIGERIRRAIASVVVSTDAEQPAVVTASVGVATLRTDEQVDATVVRADKRLYAAKQAGRDRVVGAPTPPAQATQAFWRR